MLEFPKFRDHFNGSSNTRTLLLIDKKVDFLIVGAQKCGTTALAHYLRQHNNIHLAGSTGEGQRSLHFFDRDSNYTGNGPDYSAYHQQFTPSPDTSVSGESTPAYLYWETSARRIWEYNSNIKLITMLRNPITRAYSNWNMEKQRGNEHLDFHEACVAERDRSLNSRPHQDLVHAYLARGFYCHQIRRLKRFFPDNQLLFIKYDELRAEPHSTINDIYQFLGVQASHDLVPELVHKRRYERELLEQDHQFLLDIFEHEIRGLERLLNWNCSDWLL